MRPLAEALRVTTQLKRLECQGSDMSRAFARRAFLPAVRDNTSLRGLEAKDFGQVLQPELEKAEALVRARSTRGRTLRAV